VAVLGEAPNRVLEYSVVNAVDNPFFPLSVSNGNSKVLDRAAVSQIMVRSGRFLEFSILEKNYDAESEDALIKRLTAACRKWRESLEIKE